MHCSPTLSRLILPSNLAGSKRKALFRGRSAGPKSAPRGALGRRLVVDLASVAQLLHRMAERPGWYMDGTLQLGAAGVAALRWREAVSRKESCHPHA